ncbi:aldose epimerase family protein [Sphingomonas sp.]|uniref:aldose epimerase family protein n=1 Tax=Sphingomonas sp. TaxID=28214 RepID=UPI003B3B6B70
MTIEITRQTVRLRDGRETSIFRIAAQDGVIVWVAELGATLLRIEAPDREGHRANVILGDVDIQNYPAALGMAEDPRFGASCGRVANRIAGAAFTLDGEHFALDANEAPNHLHGGSDGFSRQLWRGQATPRGVEMTLVSPDGDQGYPGTVSASARFELVAPDRLALTYRATTDRSTHVNIVSHPYFNLSGDPAVTIDRHQLEIAAESFLPIDAMALPVGAALSVHDTPFDFRKPRAVGDVIDADHSQIRAADGFNHCFILSSGGTQEDARFAARLRCPGSGRVMTLFTDQPALQFYSGNALQAADPAGSHIAFARRTGLCLEAQAFPNAANRPDFPTTRLDPGQEYRSELRLLFAVED